MAATKGNEKGIITVEFGCGSNISEEQNDSIDIGKLKGKYIVLSWPNADQHIFRDKLRGIQYLKPGDVLDFGTGEQIYISTNTLMCTYKIQLMPINTGDIIRIDNPIQWQRVSRPDGETIASSASKIMKFFCRISGLAYIRISSTVSGTATVRVLDMCGDIAHSFPNTSISVGDFLSWPVMDDLGSCLFTPGNNSAIRIGNGTGAISTFHVEVGGSRQ